MKELTTDELLRLQLEILHKVDVFCRERSIQYTVFGGTAIGAVRHKGYIPWDDDIDIAMTRPNYDRFIHSFNGKVSNLEVIAPELNWNYYATYANVCDVRTILDEGINGHLGMNIGVKIDVFPIDSVSSNIMDYHNDKKYFGVLWDLLYVKRINIALLMRSNKKAAVLAFLKRLRYSNRSYESIQKEIRQYLTRYPFEETEYVDLKCFPWPTDSKCKREIFEDYEDIQFEDLKVSIIKEYDEYLTKSYGDYMKLPPIEKRVPHHGFTAWWK